MQPWSWKILACATLCRLLQCVPTLILVGEGGGSPYSCPLQGPSVESVWGIVCSPAPSLLGVGGGLPRSSPLQGLDTDSGHLNGQGSLFMVNWAESLLLDSSTETNFPAPMLGNSPDSGTFVLSVTLGTLRPHCPIWDSALLYH